MNFDFDEFEKRLTDQIDHERKTVIGDLERLRQINVNGKSLDVSNFSSEDKEFIINLLYETNPVEYSFDMT